MKKLNQTHIVCFSALLISVTAMSFKPATKNQEFVKSQQVAIINPQVKANQSEVAITAAVVAATRAAVAYTSVVAEATAEAAAEACPELLLAAAILVDKPAQAKLTTMSADKYNSLMIKSKELDLDKK